MGKKAVLQKVLHLQQNWPLFWKIAFLSVTKVLHLQLKKERFLVGVTKCYLNLKKSL
jgi:hypothetical protein